MAGQKGCPKAFWIFLAGFFFLILLGEAGFVIWRELWSLRLTTEVIIDRFAPLFRTAEEQVQFEEAYFDNTLNYLPVNETVDLYNCSVSCPAQNDSLPSFGRMSETRVIDHACCQTTVILRPMDEMPDLIGRPKKIAQFASKQQYFKIESCRHIRGFRYGRCQQQKGEIATAVTVKEDLDDGDKRKYAIEWVRVPGSCKCFPL